MTENIRVASLLLTLVLASCAVAPRAGLRLDEQLADKNLRVAGEVSRIQNDRIIGWSTLDRTHFILQSYGSRSYLVTLQHPCYNLDDAFSIALSAPTGILTRFDKVLVRDRANGHVDRCVIESLHQLEKLNPA